MCICCPGFCCLVVPSNILQIYLPILIEFDRVIENSVIQANEVRTSTSLPGLGWTTAMGPGNLGNNCNKSYLLLLSQDYPTASGVGG